MIDNDGPQIDPKQALDLSEVARAAEERDREERAAAERREQIEVQRWLKAMRRAFKGTGFTHAQRVRNLQLAAQRAARAREELGE
jgi:hypothetical protein